MFDWKVQRLAKDYFRKGNSRAEVVNQLQSELELEPKYVENQIRFIPTLEIKNKVRILNLSLGILLIGIVFLELIILINNGTDITFFAYFMTGLAIWTTVGIFRFNTGYYRIALLFSLLHLIPILPIIDRVEFTIQPLLLITVHAIILSLSIYLLVRTNPKKVDEKL